MERRDGPVPGDGAALAKREGGKVGGGAVEPSGGAAELRVFEDGDAHRALWADGTKAIVEGAAPLIAEEFEVVDIGPGFDDEDFAAVVELGEEGDAAGGSGGLGGDGGNECGGEGERREEVAKDGAGHGWGVAREGRSETSPYFIWLGSRLSGVRRGVRRRLAKQGGGR